MKRFIKKTAACMLAALIAFSCMFVQVFAEESSTADTSESSNAGSKSDKTENAGLMNLDVVFVLDASGSMTKSDPKKIAIDAYRMFVELLDNTCGIGYVVFSHELLDTGDIVDTSDKEALDATKKKMASVKYDLKGYTDIALGLTKAKDMLTTDEIESDRREKLVILLTDGNTALPKGGRSLEDSNDELDATLLTLHDRQIPVYSIGLNYNGKMKKEELQHISEETEGSWHETGTSEELLQVFSEIFAKVNKVSGEEGTVKDGQMSIDVTDNTVSDVNLIIKSALSLEELQPVLVNPNGETIPVLGNDSVSVSSTDNYSMLKLSKPLEGEWTLKFNGYSGSDINVTRMDYYSVYLQQQVREVLESGDGISITDYLQKGAKVSIEATVRDQDGVVTDKDLLKTLNLVATVAKENGKTTNLPMMPSFEEGKYYVEWVVDDTAKAEIKTAVENSKFKKETAGDTYLVLSSSDYVNKMMSTGQYTEDYLSKVRLSDGRMGNQTWSKPEDSGNAGFTVIILIVVIAMVIGVIIIISIIRSKIPEKALGGEVKFQEPFPLKEKEEDKPKKPFVPEKPIVMPEAKDPDLVNYELIEHDDIENLIRKGPEDAFNANADAYQTDEKLEALVRKGPDNVFAVGTDKLPEEEDGDEYDDEYGEDYGDDYGTLDEEYEYDDDEEDDSLNGVIKTDDNYGVNGGFAQDSGYAQDNSYGLNGVIKTDESYGMNGGYPQNSGYGMNGGYPQNNGYGMNGGYPQNSGYGMNGGYPQNGGYGMNDGYPQNNGYGMNGGYSPENNDLNDGQ